MVELSFYWSLLGSQFYDVKRKDFWYVCKSVQVAQLHHRIAHYETL